MAENNKLTETQLKQKKRQKLMDGVAVWAAFYRENPNRFARDYLHLKLDVFQQIILNSMFRCSNIIYLASRGGGKSFLIAVFCVCYAILYPGSRICIASKTRKQAGEVIDKVKEILIPLSPYLKAEISEAISNQADNYIKFKNTSKILVVTASETARHNRATVLIIDEFRMVDKSTIDMVLRKFLTSQRHPLFLDKPEYKNYPKEKTKEVYASSCWYENHWSYEHVRSYVVNMIQGRSYFCCSMPYQLAIKEGRLDREKIEDEMSETTFNLITFRMEMEALFFGSGNSGLYNYDEIVANRTLPYAAYPDSPEYRIKDKRLMLPPKVPNEIRVLSLDVALMSSAKNKNDASSIFLNVMTPKPNGGYTYNIVYADNNEGLRTDEEALVIRRLFSQFDCDYLALDVKGIGLGVYDALTTDIYDKEYGVTYPALSCYNNEELANRCTSPEAPKAIWAIQGSAEFNSQCTLMLREVFRKNEIKLLVSEYDAEDLLSQNIKGYNNLTPEEMLDYKLPYIHTTLLINELIDLQAEVKNNVVKVRERAGGRKDRYSSLSYNIYTAKAIEREMADTETQSIEAMVVAIKRPKNSRRRER